MGCNCWRPSKPRAIAVQRQNKPAPVQPKDSGGKLCKLCGWAVKTILYADPATKATVQKTACTNRQCQNYR